MLPNLKSLLFRSCFASASLFAGCSLLFHEADPTSASEDATPPAADAGPVLPWEATVEWKSTTEPYHTAGVVEEGTTIKLVGELRGEMTVASVPSTPSGTADLGFMSLDPNDGTPVSLERFGDVGTPTILRHRAHGGAHSVVGIFSGLESFCPKAVFVGCSVAPPGTTYGAFASQYSATPSAAQDPTSVVTLTYTANTKSVLPDTLIQSGYAFDDRQIIVGSFKKDISVTGVNGVFVVENTEESSKNLFMINLSADGDVVEAVAPDLSGNQIGWAVEPSGEANVFVVGTYEGSLDLGLDEGQSVLPPSGGNALFVLHANKGLSNALWARPFGTGVSGLPVYARATGDDGLIVAGSFVDSLFLPGNNTLQDPGGGESVFVLKISQKGEIEWAKTFGTDAAKTRVRGLVIGSDQEVFLTGEFEGTMDLGDSTLTSTGDVDAFLIRIDALGRTRGGISLGSSSQGVDKATRLFILQDNSVLVELIDYTVDTDPPFNIVGRTLYRVR